ncbi:glycosyltransferase family 1 protein [Microbacterium sp. dk485]|uniref:glycosyltransferase family 1 protein n=1 Tax=Microbacterium sp. dk485 TaxID=2560021 RepID=UPI001073D69B|nr:glycosyltransferase family 1 protein [Microbacterium sp. dk485]TFV84077.1 glycosyltransferase family 1 protein [Microbacterium sp. dk485]
MVTGRVGALWRRVRRKSPRQLAQRVVSRLADAVDLAERDFPLHEADIFDSTRAGHLARAARSAPTRIAWIVVPPGIGSGGHTTLFRLIRHAARAGISNTLFFYDRHNGDFQVNVERLRRGWPDLDCDVQPLPDRLDGFDAYVASAWPTVHALATRTEHTAARRVYFIQDYEPYFSPRGTLSTLAEDTYRFGFDNIALGPMVVRTLERELGVASHVVPFGQDALAYAHRDDGSPRAGVAFFAKTNNERRGYRLALLALREFQRRRPDVPVHVYGDTVRETGLRVVNHGYLTPGELDALYNAVVCGLVLSFTNISLIPAELAAAGAVPVMNEDAAARLVFDNPAAQWAAPTPTAIADVLERIVGASAAEQQARARAVAAWRGPSWEETAEAFLAHLGVPAESQR